MAIIQTVYNRNLRSPDSLTVKAHGKKATFGTLDECIQWLKEIWAIEFFPEPGEVYYNVDWDNDNILYCTYELRGA